MYSLDLSLKLYRLHSDSSQRLHKETKENTDTAIQILSIIVRKSHSIEVGSLINIKNIMFLVINFCFFVSKETIGRRTESLSLLIS